MKFVIKTVAFKGEPGFYYVIWDCEYNRQISNHYTSLPYAIYDGLGGLVGW